MSFYKKSTAVALSAILTLASFGSTTSTYAHDNGFRKFHRHQHTKHEIYRSGQRNILHGHQTHHHKRKLDSGKVGGVLLGILGAAIVIDALSKTHKPQAKTYPRPYDPPLAGQYPPTPNQLSVVYHTQSLEPWTPGWIAWCKERYRSFNEHTGTYRGYDGLDHFCVPK